MDPVSIAAVIGLAAVIYSKKKGAVDPVGANGVPSVGSTVPDPGVGAGSTEVLDPDNGQIYDSSNDGAGQVITEQTGSVIKQKTQPSNCACIRPPCNCSGVGSGPTMTPEQKLEAFKRERAAGGVTEWGEQPTRGYDGSGIMPTNLPLPPPMATTVAAGEPSPQKPNVPSSPIKPNTGKPTTGKPTTGGTTTTFPGPRAPILTSLKGGTAKDAAKLLQTAGPGVGAIW